MFHYHIHSFGPFERHELASKDGSHSLSFIPGHGTLWQVRLQGKDLLLPAPDGESLRLNRWARGNLLFPFPNRLEDGQFEWEGKTHAFPLNDAATGNALHGFYGQLEFEPVDSDVSTGSGKFLFEHHPDQPASNFPFQYSIRLLLEISLETGFRLTTTVVNLGRDRMPLGWGWHPYFQLGEELENWMLKMPPSRFVGIDQRMIPTGKLYDYDTFSSGRTLTAERLDNCFSLLPPEGIERVELEIKDETGSMTYWQENGRGKYPFVQLFIPPDRKSLAIEPMTCNVNALNSGDGLIVLQPGESAEAAWGLSFRNA